MDDPKSERFGRYQILSELGRGAMGVVYQARDPKINRVVAVKTISMAGQPPEEELEYRERFFREAEAAGRLSHPGIVTIFDMGEEPKTHTPYIVMEFVGGQSLDKLVARDEHKLPLETSVAAHARTGGSVGLRAHSGRGSPRFEARKYSDHRRWPSPRLQTLEWPN